MSNNSFELDVSLIRQHLNLADDEDQITRQCFAELAGGRGMSSDDLDIIFSALDSDHDGVISIDDLLEHWQGSNFNSQKENGGVDEKVEDISNSKSIRSSRKTQRKKSANSKTPDNLSDNEFYNDNAFGDVNSQTIITVTDHSEHEKDNLTVNNTHIPHSKSLNNLQQVDSSGSEFQENKDMYSVDDLKVSPNIRKLRAKSPRPASLGRIPLRQNKDENSPDLNEKTTPVELTALSDNSQEQVCELYNNLYSTANPELVSQFESIIVNVIKDVRTYQQENERLEKTYKKEKEEHDKHLRRLEEEMELQVQNIESRVKKREQERLECEKMELQSQLDAEIKMLQLNLKKLTQEGENKMDKGQEEHLLSMKKRLEEVLQNNRMLKSELTDAQTNLALVKSQMTSVKQKLDEKVFELEVENQTVQDYASEQENLRRQLQQLFEANKNLLDTNDNLREMLDTSPSGPPSFKRAASTDSGTSARSASPNFPRKGSVMSDYVDVTSPGNRPLLQGTFQESSGMMPHFLALCEEDSIAEDLDSGHSTLRDLAEVDLNDDTEVDSVSVASDIKRGRRHKKLRPSLRAQHEEPDSHDELESDNENVPVSLTGFRRSPSTGSRSSNKSNRSLTRDESVFSQSSRSSRGSSRRQLPTLPAENVGVTKIAKEPERMYKIVLAGDAAVGKSSFIVRLCKNKWVPNLSSTLGVDFQTKMLDVDGQPTALQLWDTAGQERFRSVAKTYFRRADGVLLLYDVTYERSFLNLREWVDTIEDGALKKIPIMLIGNKTDARQEWEQRGRRVVKHSDGARLAKELEALFIETSAKEGSNISEAVIELTRILRTNEDLEVQTSGMQLHTEKSKKSGNCCSRS